MNRCLHILSEIKLPYKAKSAGLPCWFFGLVRHTLVREPRPGQSNIRSQTQPESGLKLKHTRTRFTLEFQEPETAPDETK